MARRPADQLDPGFPDRLKLNRGPRRGPRERARAVGTWGGISGLGGTAGVILSGVLTSYVGWRWIFLINVPIAAIVLVIAPRMVKESHSSTRQRIDVAGALLVTASLVLVVYGLLQAGTRAWGAVAVVIPLAAGGVLLVAFIVSQMLISSPLVPPRSSATAPAW